MAEYKIGKIIKGCVTGIENYGVFVSLEDYYNGLIHISELSYDFIKDINDIINIGETIYVKILDVDEEAKKLKLSIKDIDFKEGTTGRKPIMETKLGFTTLKVKLGNWIKDKINE